MNNVPPSVRAALKRRGADAILNQEGDYSNFKAEIDRIIHGDNQPMNNIVNEDYDEEYEESLSPEEQRANERIDELGEKYKTTGNDKDLYSEKSELIKKYQDMGYANDLAIIHAEKDMVTKYGENWNSYLEKGKATDEDLYEELADNEYIYGNLNKDQIAQVLSERKGIDLNRAKEYVDKNFNENFWGEDMFDDNIPSEKEIDDIRKQEELAKLDKEFPESANLKPQSNRFSKEPNIKDYDINDELKNNLRDYEYYSRIDDINKELENEKSWKQKMMNERFRTQDDFDRIDRRISLLSDPRIQKYVNDRNSFNKQFEKDYEEYRPIAKEAIIAKLLSDQDLYDIESDSNTSSDLYDQVNSDFAKKYGYERTRYGDMFKPGRRGFDNFLEGEERITMDDGSRAYRRKLNKDKYLANLLDQGEITLADLRRLLK